MKTIRTIAQGLLLLLPAALAVPATPPPAEGSAWQTQLRRTCWRWGTQRQQVLAWLRAWGPFTQPPPGMLPAGSVPAGPAPTGSLAMGSR